MALLVINGEQVRQYLPMAECVDVMASAMAASSRRTVSIPPRKFHALTDNSGLLGLISNIAPTIVGGNTCVVLASEKLPLSAVSFAEVLHASDVPAGVVNILTGYRDELAGQFASHMDVNAVIYCDGGRKVARSVQEAAADNIKHVIARTKTDWTSDTAQHPYLIRDTQEVKTTWHPIGV